MNNIRQHLEKVEYYKVLELVSNLSITKKAKSIIQNEEPLYDLDLINTKLNELELVVSLNNLFGPLNFTSFSNIDYIESLLSKNGVLEITHILEILNLINAKQDTINYLSLASQKLDVTSIKEQLKYEPFNQIRSMILSKIREDGFILDNASLELSRLRSKKTNLEQTIRQKLNEQLQKDRLKLTDSIITLRDNRYTLPYKIEFKNKIDGLVRDISNTSTTCYIEPRCILDDSDTLLRVLNDIKIEEREILKKLSLFLNQFISNIVFLENVLVNLDVLFSKAKFCGKKACKPIISYDDELNLKGLYHPLLDKEKAVPLNLYKKKDIKGYIITGPNTGGKTVVLKTICLYSALVQTGYFTISKDICKFKLFNNFLVDIGDMQSIETSLSTFSSHITNINSFFNYDLKNSLIIIDELASGTDPIEGEALATAIIDYFRFLNTTFFITTHYNNLKQYAIKHKDVLNASMIFREKDNTPTYQLQEGIPGSSYALKICSNLGFVPDIIYKAYDYLNSKRNILDLEYEKEIERYKTENKLLQEEKELISLKLEELNQKLSFIEQQKSEIINKAILEANMIKETAKLEALEILDTLKQEELELQKRTELSKKIKSLTSTDLLTNEEFKVGDSVYIIPYQNYGVITNIKGSKYTVNFSMFSLEFKKSDLKLETKKQIKKTDTKQVSVDKVSKNKTLSLDLRGTRVIDVDYLVNDFIDKSLLDHIEEITIIHGFGTGAVRKRVHELLKINKHIKSYRFGQEGEGLNGVTVCKLK